MGFCTYVHCSIRPNCGHPDQPENCSLAHAYTEDLSSDLKAKEFPFPSDALRNEVFS
jgi:hypothetical protein